ncbi:MAG: glycosyltransferase family 4 protein [Acidobacteriota bacterium]|nr:glycosyltransferase family 4 protein [Acidobacteriota bacterium]
MRIGIDGIPLAAAKTGVGHYTFELARHLAIVAPADQFELVSPFPFVSSVADEASQLPSNLRFVRAKVSPLRKHWWTIGLPLYAKQVSYDLFHGTNYNVPLWNRRPTVVTIHDLSLFLHPETHENHLVRRARLRLPTMTRTATRIITPSESIRREVCQHLGVSADKVVTIPEAARPTFKRKSPSETLATRRRLRIEDQFILFVGTIEPRKNLITLLRAFDEIMRSTSLRPQLVIAGKEGWLSDDLFAYLHQTAVDRVRFTGYIADDELAALYSSCSVFVYPSLYEGFGLPPLEAMACGAPVVTSRIPSLVETVGDAARLVDPMDVNGLAQAIVKVLQDPGERLSLSAAGQLRATHFTWEKAAAATLGVYTEVLENRTKAMSQSLSF